MPGGPGLWADRLGRRWVLTITADVGRATLLVSVPVCYALHMVNGAFQVVSYGTRPLGALVGGAAAR